MKQSGIDGTLGAGVDVTFRSDSKDASARFRACSSYVSGKAKRCSFLYRGPEAPVVKRQIERFDRD